MQNEIEINYHVFFDLNLLLAIAISSNINIMKLNVPNILITNTLKDPPFADNIRILSPS